MTLRKLSWVSLLFLFSWPVLTRPAQQPSLAKVDRIFAAWNKPDSPGCSLLIVKDGRIAYEHGYGMANLELGVRNSPRTVFDIGSVSKQFTAMAVVLLVQDGKLSLDDDIRKYLPEIPDYGSTITIRNLLYHTSGLRDYDDLFDIAGIPEIDLTTDRDALALVTWQKALNFKPGEQFLYSDTGYFLLSEIIERVTGETLREFAQARIFKPLGMTSTHIHDDHTMIVPNRATGYAPHTGGGFEIDMSSFEQVGDGSVMTTVDDLYKWDQNFSHPVVGGTQAIRELTKPGTLNNGTPIKYGMGMFIDHYRGLRWIHHSGEWVGYRAASSRFPDQHFSTWLTCNSVGSMNPMQMALQVADLYLGKEFRDDHNHVLQRPATATDDPSKYAGSYWNQETGSFRRFVEKNGHLDLISTDAKAELLSLGGGQFQYSSQDMEVSNRYEFHRQSDGRYTLQEIEDGVTVTYQPVKNAEISPLTLEEYAGTYKNDELKTTWILFVKNGKLVRRQWMNWDQELRPAFYDGFTGDLSEGEFTLHFTRDSNHKVTGFEISTEMVRPMRFEKIGNDVGAPSTGR